MSHGEHGVGLPGPAAPWVCSVEYEILELGRAYGNAVCPFLLGLVQKSRKEMAFFV